MSNILAKAKLRMMIAEDVYADLIGSKSGIGGLKLTTVGGLTCIDDGCDLLLVPTDDFYLSIEAVVGFIVDGDYDRWLDSPQDLARFAYEDCISATTVIYSRQIGSLDNIAELELNADALRYILDALNVTEEEYIAETKTKVD